MTKTKALALACAVAFLSALLFGQSSTELLTSEEINDLNALSHEWRMRSESSSTDASPSTWIYNSKTGKVYRVFEKCGTGTDGANGCLSALPV